MEVVGDWDTCDWVGREGSCQLSQPFLRGRGGRGRGKERGKGEEREKGEERGEGKGEEKRGGKKGREGEEREE